MAESLLSKLTSSIQPITIAQIAAHLGVPERAVSRGLELSTGAVFGALAQKSTDRAAMQQTIDVASRTPTDTIATAVSTGQFTDPASPVMSSARSFLSWLFGTGSGAAADAIGREAGLGTGATATMMALGAHSLLNYIGSRVRDVSLNASSLGEFLDSEAPGMRKLMPGARMIDVNPIVAQGKTAERSFVPWVIAAVIAAALAVGWLGLRNNSQVTEPLPSRPVGTSGTLTLPDVRRTMHVLPPQLDVDRLRFESGSAILQPQSHEQLQSIASMLKANPDAHVKIRGYSDDVGSADSNMKLSDARAVSVRNQLVGMGVDVDRLSTEGYGEANPVGDNSTEAGRAMNRRVSMMVTEK